MGLSRSVKISILLAIDTLFFLIELIAGYAVGSLALVADSFHMLNDVMSLVVALYAIKLTQNSVASAQYSYGWHRAEILAALVNGVFLLALCFSIFIEAIERFFSVPEVGNPKLVVIVGSCGLLSNIIGLFLFHEHDHDHGAGGSESSTPRSIVKPVSDQHPNALSDTSPLLPSQPTGGPVVRSPLEAPSRRTPLPSHRQSDSLSRSRQDKHRRSDSTASISFHPAQVRASLLQVAEELRAEGEPTPEAATSPRRRTTIGGYMTQSAPAPGEGGTLEEVLRRAAGRAIDEESSQYSRAEEGRTGLRNDVAAELNDDSDDDNASAASHDHGHRKPHGHGSAPGGTAGGHGGGHGHSHGSGSMNMRAVLLHVIGDALGNVGVIATGLIIWLTDWKYKFYCDPLISLVITIIIFSSALPLVKSTSFILLQGVPSSVNLQDVHNAISRIPGVLSVHELHIWQLSETKLVASVHVLVKRMKRSKENGGDSKATSDTAIAKPGVLTDTDDTGEHAYMAVASEIRRVLHEFGIHSSTIQPEYCMDHGDEADSIHSGCLIPCMAGEGCDPANACCPPVVVSTPRSVE